jgi:hypothetical protein
MLVRLRLPRLLRAIGVTAAALLFAHLGVAQSQPNRLVAASERVTIFAIPTVHGRAQAVTLLGSAAGAKANEIVTIEAKECGGTAFRKAFEVHTDAGGGWTFQIAPTITTTLRAV